MILKRAHNCFSKSNVSEQKEQFRKILIFNNTPGFPSLYIFKKFGLFRVFDIQILGYDLFSTHILLCYPIRFNVSNRCLRKIF